MTAAASAAADLPIVEQARRAPNAICERGHSATVPGLLQNALLPSMGLHGGLSIIAYGIARTTDRVEIKDCLWPSGMVLNAWWTAVGRHSLQGTGAPAIEVLRSLSYSQKLLLGAVTAWGARLFYRIVKRSLSRGQDDARYEKVKYQRGFWNKASLLFGLEALFQTAISLPFTLPFRAGLVSGCIGAPAPWAGTVRWSAAAIFAAGLTLETVADWQLDSHKKREVGEKEQRQRHDELLTTGVWSIVRHPNYFGDFLVHCAFPLWNYGSQLFTWTQLLSPTAYYFFLRYIGGDRENEASQVERYSREDRSKHAQFELYQIQKHSFWPSVSEIANPWSWAISGIGAAAAAATCLYESRIAPAVIANTSTSFAVGETIAGTQ